MDIHSKYHFNMGAFNTVGLPWTVPGTCKVVEIKVQFKFGDTWQYEYRVGDTLRWGGNDIGDRTAKHVVVDGCLESASSPGGVPEDFEVHVVDGVIERVVPSTGRFDFSRLEDTYVVLEK